MAAERCLPSRGSYDPVSVTRLDPDGPLWPLLTIKSLMEDMMAWTAPKIEEFACGMEINMYYPADEDSELF